MNVNTVLIDMPAHVRGHTVKNDDDSYSIFINARSSFEDRLRAYRHELQHIEDGDFDETDVQAIENNAHN